MTLIDKAETLLPCPFCGEDARAVEDASHSTAYAVGCFNEDCAVEPYVWNVSKAKAITAWNHRAAPPDIDTFALENSND